jgi:hypothetical protein
VDSILKLGLACAASIDNITDCHPVSFHFALSIAVAAQLTPSVHTGVRLLVNSNTIAVDVWQLHGRH